MTRCFTLPDRLDSTGAAELVQMLLQQRDGPLTIDASGVTVIGARAMEVLIAAGRQWEADGCALTIAGGSDRYVAACETMGLVPEAPWQGVMAERGEAA